MMIRELQENDSSTVVDLLMQLGYGGINAESVFLRSQLIKKHGGIVFVVENDEKNVIGFAAITIMPMIHCDGFLARIAAICIDEKSRSEGIGKKLIRFIEEYCTEKNCVLLEVTTKLARERAHQFYLKNGFAETHKRYNKIPAVPVSKPQ